MSKIELLNIDCMEYMATCKDNHFDWAIVDPPYGIKWSDRTDDRFVKRHNKTKAFNSNMKWDEKPSDEYWTELKRVSKNQIVWGINYFSKHFDSFIPIFWDKMNGASQYSDGELCGITTTNKARIIKHAYIGRYNPEPKKIHPTQKPTYIYKWILENYTNENDLILDTHLGSGSIAIACHYMKRKLIGCEIDKEYFEAAKQRFELVTSQLKLDFGSVGNIKKQPNE
jgi:site-specific DNA-methyltransferase (adenine-specific)